MSGREIRELLSKIDMLIDDGQLNEAKKLLKNLNISDLTDDEKRKYETYKSIVSIDLVYFIVFVLLVFLIFGYFIIVKH